MEKEQLLETLNGLVASYEKHQQFIDKARSQAASGKFKPGVVEKVIRDHEARCSDVAGQVAPLLPELAGLRAHLERERSVVLGSKAGIDEQVQEAELRAAIGELSDEDLEDAVGALRGTLAEAQGRVAMIDADVAEIDQAVSGWIAISGSQPAPAVAQAAAPVVEPEPAYEPEPAPAPEVHYAEPEISYAAPVPEPAPSSEEEELAEGEAVGAHAARTEIRDDVSVVFASGLDSGRSGEEDIAIETGEVNDPSSDGPAADVQFGFEEDILGGGDTVNNEVEIDLGGGGADSAPVGRPSPKDERPAEPSSEAPRRALLLYQEGTAEEQIYPFTGDTLTIGRGRENDIQIKNDSKVSRYHCKLFRRGNNFYIEDAKSSNGTLVNGELITDRRLFGGEEVIIGETFFRFRIME